jgi:dTDP-4-amino-4,6-dideoxygalactose transaminase
MMNVTHTFLPPMEEYNKYLEEIWKRNWLTNNGPLFNELEVKLREYLGLGHLLYLTNGTIALQIAIKALGLKGEIITTPFSYVATTSSIVWEGCEPVFTDIDPDTLNINPDLIEAAITKKTSAILATHVFGNPCEIEKIEEIARKHNLKVIYDAAHCFGTTYKGKSVFKYGDISTLSFHATKLFHTIEGGAIATRDPDLAKKTISLRNFGHKGYEDFAGLGINGKNSEFHAAMGLCNLKYVEDILLKRKEASGKYNKSLEDLKVSRQLINKYSGYNHAYYPVIFETEAALLKAKNALEAHQIFARRYFYPCLASLNYVKKQQVPVADSISARILCLPMFYGISTEEIDMVGKILLRTQKSNI